ncbi:hypothetical protein D3C87_1958430 [compost metagenome]
MLERIHLYRITESSADVIDIVNHQIDNHSAAQRRVPEPLLNLAGVRAGSFGMVDAPSSPAKLLNPFRKLTVGREEADHMSDK